MTARAASIAATVSLTAVSTWPVRSMPFVICESDDEPRTISSVLRVAALVLLDQELGEVLLLALELGLLGHEPRRRDADLAVQHVQVPADLVVALGQELDVRIELPHLRAHAGVLRLLLLKQRVSRRGAREDRRAQNQPGRDDERPRQSQT